MKTECTWLHSDHFQVGQTAKVHDRVLGGGSSKHFSGFSWCPWLFKQYTFRCCMPPPHVVEHCKIFKLQMILYSFNTRYSAIKHNYKKTDSKLSLFKTLFVCELKFFSDFFTFYIFYISIPTNHKSILRIISYIESCIKMNSKKLVRKHIIY